MESATDPLSKALQLLQSALELLDQAGAPADIGAHLDFTIVRLLEALEASTAADGANWCLPSSSPQSAH